MMSNPGISIKSIIRYIYKFCVLKLFYPLVYKICSLRKMSPHKAVFIEVRGLNMSSNFTLIWDELLRREYDCRLHCLGLSSVSGWEGNRRCFGFVRDIADAGVIFINDGSNILSSLPLRKETQVVQTWHACGAFKRFGLSTAEHSYGGSRHEQTYFHSYKNCDIVTVSSPEVVWAYSEAMDIPKERIKPVGVSRTDVLFDKYAIDAAVNKVREKMRIPKDKKILLYAPTFRGENARNARPPEFFDADQAINLLSDEYFIVIKHHPFIKILPVLPKNNNIDYVPNEITIDEALMAADLCVTDYSSLVFEYSLLRRPVYFLAPDIDDYVDERGFYYPFAEFAPGPVVSTTAELAQKILGDNFDYNPLDAFRGKFMSACDGQSTERIMELVNL